MSISKLLSNSELTATIVLCLIAGEPQSLIPADHKAPSAAEKVVNETPPPCNQKSEVSDDKNGVLDEKNGVLDEKNRVLDDKNGVNMDGLILFSKCNPFADAWKLYTDNIILTSSFKISSKLRRECVDTIPVCFQVSSYKDF